MNKQEIIQNWIYLSDYDIATAKVMLDTKRYLYVAFMCQQAFELRQNCDYREFVDITKAQTKEIVENAKAFIAETQNALEKIE